MDVDRWSTQERMCVSYLCMLPRICIHANKMHMCASRDIPLDTESVCNMQLLYVKSSGETHTQDTLCPEPMTQIALQLWLGEAHKCR